MGALDLPCSHKMLQKQSRSKLFFCRQASQSWAEVPAGIWAPLCLDTCPVGSVRWPRCWCSSLLSYSDLVLLRDVRSCVPVPWGVSCRRSSWVLTAAPWAHGLGLEEGGSAWRWTLMCCTDLAATCCCSESISPLRSLALRIPRALGVGYSKGSSFC